MKKPCLLAAWCLVVLLVSPQPAAAVDESKPCIPELTDQPIAYGDVLSGENCQVNSVGDVDVFRFSGSTDDALRVVALDRSGNFQIGVCVELFGPDNLPVVPLTCGDVSIQIDPKLTMTGIHTIFVSESGNNSAFSYNLSLERLTPARADWPPIDFGQLVSDEINPASDLDAFRLNGTTGDIVRVIVVDLSGNFQIGVCVELLGPDGTPVFLRTCGDVSVQLDPTLTMTGIHTLLVSEAGNNSAFAYNVSLNCLSGCSAPKLPVCEVGLSSTGGTLDFDFTLRSATPATWNVWLSLMNSTFRLWSVGPLTIDPQVSVPITVPGFPALGTIGFLSTLTTPQDGIICGDFETVDTGAPAAGATVPTAEQLRRLIPQR